MADSATGKDTILVHDEVIVELQAFVGKAPWYLSTHPTILEFSCRIFFGFGLELDRKAIDEVKTFNGGRSGENNRRINSGILESLKAMVARDKRLDTVSQAVEAIFLQLMPVLASGSLLRVVE